jgi:hypothetical protein
VFDALFEKRLAAYCTKNRMKNAHQPKIGAAKVATYTSEIARAVNHA